MRKLQIIREMIIVAILSAAFGAMLIAGFAPEKYGAWLQKIDQGRFQYLDCNCTEAYEDSFFYNEEGI